MRLTTRVPYWLAPVLAIPLAGPAAGQQFVDSTATNFPVPAPLEYTNQLTIGDIDGDDDLDIIFANGEGFSAQGVALRQRVYINNGAGVFTDESVARCNFAGWARGVELGDIDDDGDLDMIFAQDFNKLPALFTNDGAGFFTYVTTTQLPNITLSSSRAQFGDIDNDGDMDLYITSGTSSRFSCGQYRVYVNDGLGFYTDETALRHPIGNVCNNMDCIFGDIDNDFDVDVKTASTGTNNSRLYRNDGTGVFSLSATVPADEGTYSYDFGDMDGDGDLDLLGANAGPGTTDLLLANDGTGTYTNVSGQMNSNPSQDDNDSKFFDYDNDGDMDFIIARISGPEKIYNNTNGADAFTLTAGVITSVTDSSLDVKVADLDNDGDLDIVTAQGESGGFTNRIYINSGPADTQLPRVIDTEQLPDTDDTVGPYIVRVLALDDMSSDRNFFDKGVTLHYSVGAGPEQTVPMRYSGGQVYRGAIPGQPGGTVTYYATATDWNDNTGTGESKFFDVTGKPIPGDVDGNGIVDTVDFLAVLAAWGPCPDPCPPCPADFDADCEVGITDFLTVLGSWS